MTIPLLTTKFYLPPSRPDLVPRSRLIEKLNKGLHQKLILVSAPAGFGKTTLVSSWIEQVSLPVAWLSLDEGDNDLNRFLMYLVAALQTIHPKWGIGIFTTLQSMGTVNAEILLTNLINEIAASQKDVVLVLDDYHVIESPPIDQALTYLLDHLPSQLHLVIASRIDPTLPLSRLRVRGQMIEMRVNDLRFTAVEATVFLNRTMGLDLSPQDVEALEARTEGWIAGLHLAAISMQGLKHQEVIADFIHRFTGSDRYIQDYLADEVLQQQPKEIQEFLLQTSILKRLCAPLCDAICLDNVEASEIGGSRKILEYLETTNLFIIPLDNERRWYRYHHLFAELLKHRLQQIYPDRKEKLHYRASDWYQRADYYDEAIWHAQAAKDSDKLADILEESWYVFVHRGEMDKLIRLLDSLGSEYTKASAPLSMAYAWVYYLQQNIEPVPAYLENVRKLIANESIADNIWAQTEFAVIPSLMETLEASQSLVKHNLADAKKHAAKAISLVPDDPDPRFPRLLRAAATHKLAQVHLEVGEFDRACAMLFEVLEMLKTSEDYFGVGNILSQIVSIYQTQEKTQEAISVCENTLAYFAEHRWEHIPASGMINLILADLQASTGNFEAARENLEIGRQLTTLIQTPQISSLVHKVEAELEHSPSKSQPLVEPLSERELEVLDLIGQGLTNREIGDRLYLALDTVKGHNRRIFGKLEVQNRMEAVRRAQELGLLVQ